MFIYNQSLDPGICNLKRSLIRNTRHRLPSHCLVENRARFQITMSTTSTLQHLIPALQKKTLKEIMHFLCSTYLVDLVKVISHGFRTGLSPAEDKDTPIAKSPPHKHVVVQKCQVVP